MEKWISTKDKLPESGQEILTCYYDEATERHEIGIDCDNFYFFTTARKKDENEKTVLQNSTTFSNFETVHGTRLTYQVTVGR